MSKKAKLRLDREAEHRRLAERHAAENQWALRAWFGRWFVSGLIRSAFPHQARRGQGRRWERLGER